MEDANALICLQSRLKSRIGEKRMTVLNADDRLAIQTRVKSRIGEKRVKDPMMKDGSGGWECFALLCKLGLNPDQRGLKTR